MKKHSKTKPVKENKFLLIALIVIILAGIVSIAIFYIVPTIKVQIRENRIQEIYSSFNLSDDYILQSESIFGEKKVYEWDKDRSYSSSSTYLRGADVDQTVSELDKAIKEAGFSFFDEPYEGSTFTQFHYKSDRDEYVRLTVSSKLRDDAFQNSVLMTGEIADEVFDIDPNAGPSNVTIKVNLDDNNE